jgi:hypothetical protein
MSFCALRASMWNCSAWFYIFLQFYFILLFSMFGILCHSQTQHLLTNTQHIDHRHFNFEQLQYCLLFNIKISKSNQSKFVIKPCYFVQGWTQLITFVQLIAVYPLLREGREWGAGSEEILKTRGLRQDDSLVQHGLIRHKVHIIMNLNIRRLQSLGGGGGVLYVYP